MWSVFAGMGLLALAIEVGFLLRRRSVHRSVERGAGAGGAAGAKKMPDSPVCHPRKVI